jgi:pyridoxamine 5'-phosphate oxidase
MSDTPRDAPPATRAGLREQDADPDPFRQFAKWYEEAQATGLLRPEAIALATATPDGRPSVRFVLLKGFDERGFVFFTNYESQKGRELAANPQAAFAIYWAALSRQVRVSGAVEKVERAASEVYFRSRPLGSRLSAYASPQSAVVPDRADLERRVAAVAAAFPDGNIPLPPTWGGYRLVPQVIEFWASQPDRLHDRLRYTRQPDGTWLRERLAP